MKNINGKDRLYNCKFGVFTHYIGAFYFNLEPNHGKEWNAMIENIDVKKLAYDISRTGAGYYFITLMQRCRYMLTPNATFDKIAKTKSGEACPTRDIIPELADELAKYNIDLYLYFTGDGPFKDFWIGRRFGLTRHGKNVIKDKFVMRWASVLEEYSVRYGDKVKGWWIDGCYRKLGYTDAQLQLLADAARKGNPDAIVAMNNGLNPTLVKQHPDEDFTAGEFEDFRYVPDKRFFDGAQAHILAPLGVSPDPDKPGQAWCRPGVKYDAQYMTDYIKRCNDAGAVVTVDVFFGKDCSFDEEQIQLLHTVRENLG
ncbi:MAG: hypothetical protein IJZ35_02865 [Clostridia bacterium]|nr:hypothetical protein [Clostridia bacterium]